VSEDFTKKMEEWENRKKKSVSKGTLYILELSPLDVLVDFCATAFILFSCLTQMEMILHDTRQMSASRGS